MDIIIGIQVALVLWLLWTIAFSLLHLGPSRRRRAVTLGVFLMALLVLKLTRRASPAAPWHTAVSRARRSGVSQDGASGYSEERPKRLIVQHLTRELRSRNGSAIVEHGLWINRV